LALSLAVLDLVPAIPNHTLTFRLYQLTGTVTRAPNLLV
jgi:hypothetical protein